MKTQTDEELSKEASQFPNARAEEGRRLFHPPDPGLHTNETLVEKSPIGSGPFPHGSLLRVEPHASFRRTPGFGGETVGGIRKRPFGRILVLGAPQRQVFTRLRARAPWFP